MTDPKNTTQYIPLQQVLESLDLLSFYYRVDGIHEDNSPFRQKFEIALQEIGIYKTTEYVSEQLVDEFFNIADEVAAEYVVSVVDYPQFRKDLEWFASHHGATLKPEIYPNSKWVPESKKVSFFKNKLNEKV